MGKSTLLVTCLAIIGTSSMNCFKKMDLLTPDPTPPVSPETYYPRRIKLKIIEANTLLPVSEAILTASRCTADGKLGCVNPQVITTWASNDSGDIIIPANSIPKSFYIAEIFRSEYWPKYSATGNFHSISDTSFNTGSSDSLIVKLYPVSWIRIHLKAINGYTNETIFPQLSVELKKIFTPIDFPILNNNSAKNKDTSFLIKTYGLTLNRMAITLHDSIGNTLRKVYSEEKFIGKSDTMQWQVFY